MQWHNLVNCTLCLLQRPVEHYSWSHTMHVSAWREDKNWHRVPKFKLDSYCVDLVPCRWVFAHIVWTWSHAGEYLFILCGPGHIQVSICSYCADLVTCRWVFAHIVWTWSHAGEYLLILCGPGHIQVSICSYCVDLVTYRWVFAHIVWTWSHAGEYLLILQISKLQKLLYLE